MRVTYDAAADAAYIELTGPIAAGGVASQIHSLITPGGRGEVALDFDADGRLLGIEVLHASAVLPAAVLADAVRPD
ncbi:DUF2283 domain-containing protein [Clavibacter michiganensis]|uniref:DUF2283 domain-containing protein n=1 Tax=Clavibacter michiganensis subsp. insidiosus TaxID=33014 RepID=A0A0D5CF60_9MICO|nr:DUF2283 domain-containing protein [Clavibacter michiganensis]AJW77892.1 hypothetical protein VO01_00905 [Clavibacter michiganensis subsp. insidiosus]AWF97054.1 hypothetical protein BEH61_00880 [Clavibacter michiganensis subsp. insidiosus]AWG00122.1 hypothetical protein BEH62_00730 [Clavibacter michiganensis subsp. insidiosus]OQJ58523.1 hypothetical protein B5P21_00375 [Clavibacter michiganensis subsp. insidiosus]RII88550.1 DUF2283 domain-containing protein [Clavibacter michiganensis subsp. 